MTDADKPSPVLDLDQIEANAQKEGPDPFTVKVQGQTIHFKSLEELEWEVVEDLRQKFDARQFIFEVIEDDGELNLFFEQRYSAATLERLMRDYYAHFGLDVPGETRLNRAARRARR